MSDKSKVKFSIKVDKMGDYQFSIGACISHWQDETYLFLNLFKWSVSIGLLYDEEVQE